MNCPTCNRTGYEPPKRQPSAETRKFCIGDWHWVEGKDLDGFDDNGTSPTYFCKACQRANQIQTFFAEVTR